MTTTGDKINIEGNPVETTSYDSSGDIITGYELSSIITINIDGKEIQSCGDTCILSRKDLMQKLISAGKYLQQYKWQHCRQYIYCRYRKQVQKHVW